RPDPSLELLADHSRAPAHAALDDGTAAGTVHRGPGILLRDVKAVDVVEPAVPRLRHHRQRPFVASHASPTDHPFDHGIAYDADRMGIRDHHRAPQEPRLLHPGRPGHLAVTVHREPAGEHGVVGVLAGRGDLRAACPDGALSHDE